MHVFAETQLDLHLFERGLRVLHLLEEVFLAVDLLKAHLGQVVHVEREHCTVEVLQQRVATLLL